MSDNPRQIQGERFNHDVEEENHQEERQNPYYYYSQNYFNNNTVEDINADDDYIITEMNDGDDDDNDSINKNPWDPWEREDENEHNDDDHDDCDLQRAMKRAIEEQDSNYNPILELIEAFPMQVKHKNKLGEYPLHTACEYSHEYVVLKLLELYPEAAQYKASSGMYPIHLAFHASQGYDVLIKLIEVFPEPITKSSTNGNVLHLICQHYHHSTETLIKKLIEINPKALQEPDSSGHYPIFFAILRKQSVAFIKVLLDGDPLGMQRKGQFYADDNQTIFYLACDNNYVDLVKYLMQRSDLQINVRDSSGMTPLHNACAFRRFTTENRDQIHDMILSHPDVDVNTTEDSCNDTPLHTVLKEYDHPMRRRNPERLLFIIQKLLDHEFIFINEKNNDYKTPLDLIQDRVNILEKQKNENGNRNEDMRLFIQKELSCFIQIICLLKEFPVKRRWQEYCYHIQNFTTDSSE